MRFQALGAKAFETQQNLDRQQAKVDSKASIAADEAAIETAQTQLDYTNITAPSDGRMGMRLVDPGNIVRATMPGFDRDTGPDAAVTVLFTLPAPRSTTCVRRMARGPVEVVAYRPGQPPA